MNTHYKLSLGAFAVTLVAILGAKCPSIPSIQQAAVQLVKSKSTVIGPFEARGNDMADDGMIDLVASYDIAGALDEAGVSVNDVESITVKMVEVRVSSPDPDPERAINNGTVSARLGTSNPRVAGACPPGGPFATVVSDWSGLVNAYQNFSTQNVTIEPGGIALLNCILRTYLDALCAGQDPENCEPQNPDELIVEWMVGGTTSPGTDANFDWEVRVTIDIVGEVRVDVIG